MSGVYRVGNHQPQNLYRGNTYIGVMFDPADAAMIAEVLNAREALVSAESEVILLTPEGLTALCRASGSHADGLHIDGCSDAS